MRDSGGRGGWLAALIATASLLAFSAVVAPVPALNEPHYLTKARHFWHPDWGAGDLFLESADAHVVFYATLGMLTQWLPFDAVAGLGRLLAFALLATGWSRFVRGLDDRSGVSLLALWIFLALQSIGNWSGEWLVGGIESKVFSYACLFWAWGSWWRAQPVAAACWQGLAIAFHPVVGLWALLAATGAGIAVWLRRSESPMHPRHSVGRWLLVGTLLSAIALTGLIPVVQLITAPVDPMTRYAGTYLQVYYRLAHHLDPMTIPWRAHLGYFALLTIWGWNWYRGPAAITADDAPARGHWRFWNHFVLWAVIFAVSGYLIGWGPRPASEMRWFDLRMHLLKFYPFRLADIVLPVTAAVIAAGFLRTRLTPALCRGLTVILALGTLGHGWVIGQGERLTEARDPEWQAVCEWIRTQTPRDVLVQTPPGRFTFKWYAERPEYVCYKDCPQDAAGIVEWNRRMKLLTKWYQDHYADGLYDVDELRQFHEETGVTHVIADRLGPFGLPPVYQNSRFRVYDLRALGH